MDLDVHQGNGNSDILEIIKMFLHSVMHSRSNYPAKKSISDLDVELDNNTEDKEYLKILRI